MPPDLFLALDHLAPTSALLCSPPTSTHSFVFSSPITWPSLTTVAETSWHLMSNFTMINQTKQTSSICPAYVLFPTHFPTLQCSKRLLLCSNGRQTVGDGAFSTDMTPSVMAVCHIQGNDSMYYYSTTFSGGSGVSDSRLDALAFHPQLCSVALLTSLPQNALPTEGRQTG